MSNEVVDSFADRPFGSWHAALGVSPVAAVPPITRFATPREETDGAQ